MRTDENHRMGIAGNPQEFAKSIDRLSAETSRKFIDFCCWVSKRLVFEVFFMECFAVLSDLKIFQIKAVALVSPQQILSDWILHGLLHTKDHLPFFFLFLFLWIMYKYISHRDFGS